MDVRTDILDGAPPRRPEASGSGKESLYWQFSNFKLDSIGRKLFDHEGNIVPIQPKAFRVLEVLVRDAPRVVSREELLLKVWGHSEFSISCLSQAIREIRRALGDHAHQPSIIGTEHGTGYFLLVQPQAEQSMASDQAPGHRLSPALSYSLLAMTGLFLAMIASLIVFSHNDRKSQIEQRLVYQEDSVSDPELCPVTLESYSLGVEYLAFSQWAEAIAHLEFAHNRHPESLAISFQLTRAYFHAGYQRKAAVLVEQNKKLYPPRNAMEAIKIHAAASLVKGDLLEYSRALVTLADYYPDRLDYLYELFDSQLQSGSPSIARTTLQEIATRHPAHEQDARFWLAKARLNLREGNLDQILLDSIAVEELARESSLREIQARTLLVHADALTRLGKTDNARIVLSQARSVLVMTHDPATQINLLMLEINRDVAQGRLTWIPMLINDGCQLSESIGHFAGSAYCSRLMAKADQSVSNPESILKHFDQAIQLFLQSGDILEAAMTLLHRADTELELHGIDSPAQSLVQAEEWFSRLHDKRGLALVHAAYGERDSHRRDFGSSIKHLEAALEMFGESPDVHGESQAREILARVMLFDGKPARSANLLDQALANYEMLGDHKGMARTLVALGNLAVRTGKLEEGEDLLRRALGYSQRAGQDDVMTIALTSLARAAITRADPESAHQALDHANSLAIKDQRVLASLRSAEGTLALIELDLKRSEQAFLDARSIRERTGDPGWLLESDSELAMMLMERGQVEESIALSRDILEKLPPFATAMDRFKVKLVLAEGLMQDRNLEEARDVFDSMEVVNLEDTNIALYFWYNSMKAALGQDPNSVQALNALRDRAQEMGYRLSAMEVDVMLANVMLRSGFDTSRSFVIELIDSARDKGVHCIAFRLSRLMD